MGANRKGTAYMRSLPIKVRNPRTLAQRSQRTKFAVTLRLLQPMTELLRSGWKLYAHKQSPFNAAMSYTIANAVIGAYPDYKINPAKVLISRGALTPVTNAIAAFNDGEIEFQWEDNSGKSSAKASDKTLIAIVNLAKGEAVTDTEGAERPDCMQSVPVPAEWSGDEVHAYMGFISENGKEVANSLYLGKINLA